MFNKFSLRVERLIIILTPVYALLAIMSSCHTSKKLRSAITGKDSIATLVINRPHTDSSVLVRAAFENLRAQKIAFTTFSSKIKVEYTDSKDKNYDFNAFVRIQKDSVIWVSIVASLGIEAFRVYITPDSIKIIDKLKKTVQYKTVAYIKKIAQLPVDFYVLQDIIAGNPVFLDSTHVLKYIETGSTVSLSMLGKYFKQLLILSKNESVPLHSKLDDVNIEANRTADFTYDDYSTINGRLFSAARKIAVAEKNRLDVSLDFKQVTFDKVLTFPFTVPKNYKKK